MQASRFLVTGGSQGIGAALVELAREAGHQVVFTGRDPQRIDEVTGKTGAHGLHADVSLGEDNARTVKVCQERMGGIDVLVNNAGYAYRAEIGSIDMVAMRTMFETNVFGLVDLTNRVVPLMKAQGQSNIVNIASTSGMKGGRPPPPMPPASGRCEGSVSAGRPSCDPRGSGSPVCAHRKCRPGLEAGLGEIIPTSCMPKTSVGRLWRR